MKKAEILRRAKLQTELLGAGFTDPEIDSLRRISLSLQRWYALECGNDEGSIERDETGKPYWVQQTRTGTRRTAIADREASKMRRLEKIMRGRLVSYYLQTDPRGAALYILRPGDIPEGEKPASCYTRGICVY